MAGVRSCFKALPLFLYCTALGGLQSHAYADTSLYQRLGGKQPIETIVSEFVDITMKDARIRINARSNKYMSQCDPKVVKARLSAILCEETGGPCRAAEEKSEMRKSMSSLDFSESDWKAMHEDFLATLTKFRVSEPDQTELDSLLDHARQHSVSSD
jgi:hemoglobin